MRVTCRLFKALETFIAVMMMMMPAGHFTVEGCRSPVTWGLQATNAVGEEGVTLRRALELGQIQNGGTRGILCPICPELVIRSPDLIPRSVGLIF